MSILVTGDTHGDMRRFNNLAMRREGDGEYPSHVLGRLILSLCIK